MLLYFFLVEVRVKLKEVNAFEVDFNLVEGF